MTQHQIDLLPEAMRAKSQARAAASRNIGIGFLACAVLVAVTTHAKISADRAENRLEIIASETRQLELNEAKKADMRRQLQEYAALHARYQRIESPIEISRLLATIAYLLPESATIDRIEIDADRGRRPRPPRSPNNPRRGEEAPEDRILIGEIAGFAKDDYDIVEFVSTLDELPPFDDVSLDFSRQKTVLGHSAREFRMSFSIDFDAAYLVNELAAQTGDGEVANVE